MINDISFEPVKGGIGAGGQHSNKNATGVRATHLPTGEVVVIRGRSLATSKRKAVKALEARLKRMEFDAKAKVKKDRRDKVIKEGGYIRTYNYKTMTVKDHRSGKTASLKQVLEKGRIDLL